MIAGSMLYAPIVLDHVVRSGSKNNDTSLGLSSFVSK